MARKSKAVFKMAGYTYPGTSPMANKIKKQEFDVDELHDKEVKEMEEYVVPTPENKLAASLSARLRNVGKRPKVKE